MHCKQARDRVIWSIDHTLAPDERAAVRAHIAECPECRRFAEATRGWKASTLHARRDLTPDLTERVLANVRPLPPPWVYKEHRESRQVPHYVAFAVGALGVALTFVMICLALVIGLTGNGSAEVGHRRLLMPEVWHDVQTWFNTLPGDTTHTAVTLVVACAFSALIIAWFRTLAMHVGRDRD